MASLLSPLSLRAALFGNLSPAWAQPAGPDPVGYGASCEFLMRRDVDRLNAS